MHILYYLIAAFQAGEDAASYAARIPASSAPRIALVPIFPDPQLRSLAPPLRPGIHLSLRTQPEPQQTRTDGCSGSVQI